MNTIHIERRGKRRYYRAPSEWNELTRRQIFAWCGIVRQAISVEDALAAAVLLFYKIPLDLLSWLSPGQRFKLAESLGFLDGENRLTTNVIGRVRLLGRAYHGPVGRLANVSIGEFRRTEIYYQHWLRSRDPQLLRLLAATLFRPKGKGGADDVRERMVERRINRRARLFRLLHPNWLHAILLYYEGCRAAVRKLYPRVFVKATGGDQTDGRPQPWKLVDLDTHILAFSGDKLGTYAETNEVNMHVFFKHMTQRLEEYDARQRKGGTV
ncbi:MAG TPA: hypothetical protein VNQ80_15465 [Parapedobacter sp.]|uniref:hypothetical protein n=1 Tax=Parapedobacter sp. TaxID=1958893 RepID=UPI002CA97A0D|nr:hypothetical protein [Parapedobacter sp.]HWK58741.1 hypothetical protein [Parapedobacter sp.]